MPFMFMWCTPWEVVVLKFATNSGSFMNPTKTNVNFSHAPNPVSSRDDVESYKQKHNQSHSRTRRSYTRARAQ